MKVKFVQEGIRSYDNRTFIQFGTPLTLIVGQNGTGKTTIIECLRYSATGDLPPNSKGGAFLHDPKLSSALNVKGQTKLAFVSVTGKEMVCTRTMQLTVSKTTSSKFKSLDGNLVVLDRETNSRESIGSKCADLDALMPTYLGASKSILDYVIFCHQEDSQWPLAEPAIVKKRFDEIFEATKFTKMLEDIKKMKKDITVDIKLQKQQAVHLKTDSDRASKKRQKLQELESSVKDYKEEAEHLKVDMDETLSETDKLFAMNQQFQEVLYKLKVLKHSHSVNQTNRQKLYVELNELDNGATFSRLKTLSDEAIQKESQEFASTISVRKSSIVKLKQELEKSKKSLDNLRRLLNQQTMKEGQLKAEKEACEKVLQQRQQLITELITKKEKYGAHMDTLQNEEATDAEIKSIMERIRSDLTTELERTQLRGQQAEHVIEASISSMTTSKLRLDQTILMHNDYLKDSEKSMEKIEREIYELQNSLLAEGSLDYEESELKQLSQSLQAYRDEYAEIQKENKARLLEEELQKMDTEIEQLQDYSTTLSRDINNRTRLEMLQNDLQRKKSVLDGLIKLHERELKTALVSESDIDPQKLEDQLSEKLSVLQKSIDRKQTEVSDRSNQVSEIQTLLGNAKDDLKSKVEEKSSIKNELEETLSEFDLDNYQKELDEMEEAMHTAARNKEQCTFTADYYEKAISFATKDSHKCLLCQRPFDVEEAKKFVSYLNELIGKLPVSPEQAIQEYEEVREDFNAMKASSASVQRLKVLSETEISEAEKKVAAYEEDMSDIREGLFVAKEELQGLKAQHSSIEKLSRIAGDISRAYKEAESLRTRITEEQSILEAGRSSQSQPVTSMENMTGEKLSEKLSEMNRQSRSIRSEISKISDRTNELQVNISNTQSRISAQTLKISYKKNQQQESNSKQERLRELKSKSASVEQEISSARKELENLKPELQKEEEKLARAKFNSASEEKKVNEEISEILQYISTMERLSKSIQEYHNKDVDDLLNKSQDVIARYTNQITEQEKQLQNEQDVISNEETSLADVGGQERALKDSLELRRLDRELNETEKEIIELEKKNAESRRAQYEEESKRLQSKYTSLNSSYSSRIGEIKQMEDQISQLRAELNTEFENIDEALRSASCQLDVQQNVDSDLVGWSRAVDRAMMAFHKANMDRINEIIGHLWASSYTGTDVETILIKADSEGGRTLAGRTSYNYRVCMVKRGVELDMRGRCSAGQKVLACIVIRLALAQCFGSRCGVITLDEPTTNLDANNIEALAKSLSAIIRSRNTQRNFQLIVITHDEEFLRQMQASDFTDHFFRVSRDQNQSSQIKFHHISQITND